MKTFGYVELAKAGAGIFGFGNKEAAQKFGIYTWTSPIK